MIDAAGDERAAAAAEEPVYGAEGEEQRGEPIGEDEHPADRHESDPQRPEKISILSDQAISEELESAGREVANELCGWFVGPGGCRRAANWLRGVTRGAEKRRVDEM